MNMDKSKFINAMESLRISHYGIDIGNLAEKFFGDIKASPKIMNNLNRALRDFVIDGTIPIYYEALDVTLHLDSAAAVWEELIEPCLARLEK